MTKKKLTSLIIDDNPSWLKTLIRLHNEAGYEIITAINFKEALKKAEKLKPDLIVTDIRLVDDDDSNIDGLRLLSDLKNQGLLKHSIVITGYSDPLKRQLAEEIGAEYFEKGNFTKKFFINVLKNIYYQNSEKCIVTYGIKQKSLKLLSIFHFDSLLSLDSNPL